MKVPGQEEEYPLAPGSVRASQPSQEAVLATGSSSGLVADSLSVEMDPIFNCFGQTMSIRSFVALRTRSVVLLMGHLRRSLCPWVDRAIMSHRPHLIPCPSSPFSALRVSVWDAQ